MGVIHDLAEKHREVAGRRRERNFILILAGAIVAAGGIVAAGIVIASVINGTSIKEMMDVCFEGR